MWKKILTVLLVAFLAKLCIDIYNDSNESESTPKVKVFTAEDLKTMTTDKHLYLAILGLIFNNTINYILCVLNIDYNCLLRKRL